MDSSSLKAAIHASKSSKRLDLSYQNLAEFPSEVFKLSNLEELILDFNSITFVPSQIESLTHLKRLDARNNKINSIPKELGDMENLTSVDFSSNSLKTVPPEIRNLRIAWEAGRINLTNNPLIAELQQALDGGWRTIDNYLLNQQNTQDREQAYAKAAAREKKHVDAELRQQENKVKKYERKADDRGSDRDRRQDRGTKDVPMEVEHSSE